MSHPKIAAFVATALVVLGSTPGVSAATSQAAAAKAALVTTAARVLANPVRMLTTAKRVDFVGKNAFEAIDSPFGPALRSQPRNSASGLYQSVDIAAADLSVVSWSWRVDALQAAGDVRAKATEDVGALVFFVFGEPTWLNRDVPTLAYAWSATPVATGAIVPTLGFPAMRYIQLRGAADTRSWQTETRNIAADYQRIFGAPPPALKYIAIFNDNDQTGQATSAIFAPIVALGGR